MRVTDPKRDAFHDKLDWNLLKLFSVMVEVGGVTRAAVKLGRKQPAVSLALRRLEERLKVRLCNRGPSGFELTDEGKNLAEACAQLSGLIRSVPDRVDDALHTVKGPVRIGLISNLVNGDMDKALASYNQKFPNSELLIQVATWHEVINSLLRQEIDVGIAPSRNRRADLIYLPLFTEVHRAYCGRSHPLFGKKITDAKLLAEYPFVLTGADEPDQLSDFRLWYGLGRKVAGISVHLEEARRLALLGAGLCFLPEKYAEPDVLAKRLWPPLTRRKAPMMEIYAITNPSGPMHLSKIYLVEELKAHCAATNKK